MGTAGIGIAFYPVLEKMLVSGEYRADMVRVKERHVARPQIQGGLFQVGPAMRT